MHTYAHTYSVKIKNHHLIQITQAQTHSYKYIYTHQRTRTNTHARTHIRTQMIKINGMIRIRSKYFKSFNYVEKMSSGLFKNVIKKMFTNHMHLIHKDKQDLALNNLQCLI